ncbi:S8 family serine peptidase [uncultured Ruminococcus sp.]|uniref:S8 family serine peptidase n=1 Tax=Ruminococcus sp. TaxID=41978 RepID=UPI00266CBFBE|nr:S8 family serine peptidase [uncultured Ruminococcus sp.]
MYCKRCGRELKDKAKFCPRCGTAILRPRKKKKTGKIVALTLSGLILLGACSGVFVYRDTLMAWLNQLNRNPDEIGELYFSPIDEEHVADDSGMLYADNEILLVAKEGTSYQKIEKLAKQYDGEIVGWIEKTNDYQLKFNASYSMDEIDTVAEKMCTESYVDSANPNYISYASDASVQYGKEYGENANWDEDDIKEGAFQGKNWNLKAINCISAWELVDKNTTEDDAIRVGLVDGGFDTDHEDLGFAEVFYEDGKNGTSSSNPDEIEHGTHVAGTMAAKSNNREGICGVYPYGDKNLYGCSYSGELSYDENLEAHQLSLMALKIGYAELILRNVKVINTSLGFNWYYGDNSVSYKTENFNSVEEFWDNYDFGEFFHEADYLGDFYERLLSIGYDFLIVSAAGNDSSSNRHLESKVASLNNMIEKEKYPQAYDHIIVVGAVDYSLKMSSYSNGGKRVDVFAPGGDSANGGTDNEIYSCVPNNGYNMMSGTSMASPHIAGVAAMVWTVNHNLSGAEVKKIVCDSGKLSGSDSFDEILKEVAGAKSLEYVPGNDATLVNAYAAVKTALGEETTPKAESEPENGGILSWVVENETQEPIENATVSAKDAQTGKEAGTPVKTDVKGHFELILPDGEYTLTVIADGYETYTSPDTIEVKSEGVTYVDWIELIPDEITKLVNTVIENTSIWQTNIENEDNYYSMSNGKIAGDDWIWFQDIDMDGTLEFLTMTKYLDDGSGVDRRSFNVYECDGGFSTYYKVNSDLGSSGEFSVANNQMETDTFNYTLWQKSDGNYVYLTVSSMDTLLGELSYLKFDANSCVNFPIISICSNGEGCNINWTSFESPEFSDTVSYDKAVEYYNSYFSDMVGYQTVTKKIKLSDYISQSDEEKKALLLDSAKSWNYSKDENAVKPMQDVINEASKMAADNMNYDYKQAYHNVVKSMSSGKNLFFYTLFDMNHDNIPELIIVSGTCEADAILTFYSYIDGDAVVVGDNFSGFHASFCIDVDNDQFCVQWGQMGMGGIEWYSFDGKIVTQTKTQENIDYATSQYSNDDFNNYGNFKDCEYDPQF